MYQGKPCKENSFDPVGSTVTKSHMNLNAPTAVLPSVYTLETADSLTPLIEKVGDSRLVLLGSSSYGTREFYDWRFRITERLIKEKGFSFIAVEGDMDGAMEVNRYLKGKKYLGKSPRTVLRNFKFWPTWVWANEETADFIEKLLLYNGPLSEDKKIGFYGLGAYGLYESIDAIVGYASRNDLDIGKIYEAYRCFEPFNNDPHAYAFLIPFVPEDKQEEVARMLTNMRSRAREFQNDRDDFFCAKQDALAMQNAEEYYKVMLKGNRDSWNQRETAMAQMASELLEHHGPESKGIVWANITHVADASGADTGRHNIISMGQILREKMGKQVSLVGAGTYQGEVLAAQVYGAPVSKMELPPAMDNSWEYFLHGMQPKDKCIVFDEDPLWVESKYQRDLGLVFMPAREYLNYIPVRLAKSYDALIFVDQSSALRPLANIEPEHEDVQELVNDSGTQQNL